MKKHLVSIGRMRVDSFFCFQNDYKNISPVSVIATSTVNEFRMQNRIKNKLSKLMKKYFILRQKLNNAAICRSCWNFRLIQKSQQEFKSWNPPTDNCSRKTLKRTVFRRTNFKVKPIRNLLCGIIFIVFLILSTSWKFYIPKGYFIYVF